MARAAWRHCCLPPCENTLCTCCATAMPATRTHLAALSAECRASFCRCLYCLQYSRLASFTCSSAHHSYAHSNAKLASRRYTTRGTVAYRCHRSPSRHCREQLVFRCWGDGTSLSLTYPPAAPHLSNCFLAIAYQSLHHAARRALFTCIRTACLRYTPPRLYMAPRAGCRPL